MKAEMIRRTKTLRKKFRQAIHERNTRSNEIIDKRTWLDELLKAISDNLTDKVSRMEMLIPYDKSGLAAALHSHGKVLSEEYLENGIAVTALVDKLHKYEYEEFVI